VKDGRVKSIVISSAVVTNLAGSGGQGTTDGTGNSAQFDRPRGIVVTPDGLALYVGDYGGLRKVIISSGVVTTLSVSGLPNQPFILAWAFDDSLLWVGTHGEHKLFQVTPTSDTAGTSVHYAGSGSHNNPSVANNAIGHLTTFDGIVSIATNPDGSFLWIGDWSNRRIRGVDTSNAQVSTVAGTGTDGSADGVGPDALFQGGGVWGMAMTSNGANLYLGDTGNSRIRMVHAVLPLAPILTHCLPWM
jgi:sugar lactone lactonase YvrE